MMEGTLLRRLTLWVLFALSLLESFAFLLIGSLLSVQYQHTLGGKPLPILTGWLFQYSYWPAMLPAVALLLAVIFTFWKKPSADLALFLAVALGSTIVGTLIVFAVGMVSPLISVWSMSLHAPS